MKPSPLRQLLSSAAASFQKTANQNKITGGTSLTKASLQATQGAQLPAVGMSRPYLRTMSAPMSFPSLTKRNEARFYSTNSSDLSLEEILLPHHPLDEEDHQTLKAVLGPDSYERLRHSRHRSSLCHADTTAKIIEAANGNVGSITSSLINYSVMLERQGAPLGPFGAMVTGTMSSFAPLYESIKGNSYFYTKSQLLEHGVPKDAIAVVISAAHGAIDPDSKQAISARASFESFPESKNWSHAFAVLHVDHEKRQVLCCDLDPYRQNADGTDKDVYFKVDKETFEKRVQPREIIGVAAIKKHKDDE